MKVLSILLLLAIICSSCYEDVEGCLDVNAANYDLDADTECPDNCCTFPSLSVSISHLYNDTTLRNDTFYLDAVGNSFRISRLRYYWSDIALIQSDGLPVEPTDALEIGLIESSGDTILQTINDNLTLFQANSAAAKEIGNFRTTELLGGFSTQIGIEDTLQLAAPSTTPANHPLNFQEGRMYFGVDTGYVQFKLEYELIVADDTLSRTIEAFGNQLLEFDFGGTFILPRGFNVTARFEANISEWLEASDLSGDTDGLANQLRDRMANIFQFIVIEGN